MSIDIDSLASAVLNALEKETAKILKDVKDGEFDVPVGVSNHHVHLSREDIADPAQRSFAARTVCM